MTNPLFYNRSAPYSAGLKEKKLLSKPGSSKRTYHISLDIEGSGIDFSPGDSIGLLPENNPTLINGLLPLLVPEKTVVDPRSQATFTQEEYLRNKVNFMQGTLSLLTYLRDHLRNPLKKEQLSFFLLPENKPAALEFLKNHDLIDLLSAWQEEPSSLEELAPHLAPLLPRFYSISSSLNAHPNELHLLVAHLSYPYKTEIRYGVASHFLCLLAEEKTTRIPIYVQPSRHFRLPEDPNTDVIMVGPGTGVAPYRAFLQERHHRQEQGRNWLFFGERTKSHDFLYEEDLKRHEEKGFLRLETAFSRDGEKKEYVQHKLLLHSRDIWDWLETGAYFYVCGDASKMAKDVEAALLTIFQKEGSLTESDAKQHLKALRQAKRYCTDVY